MCLLEIDDEPKVPRIQTGYKVFIERNNNIEGKHVDYTYKKNEWLHTNVPSKYDRNKPLGFHIYVKKEDAINEAKFIHKWNLYHYIVYQVWYEDVVATGIECGVRAFSKVIVARDIKLVKKVLWWRK